MIRTTLKRLTKRYPVADIRIIRTGTKRFASPETQRRVLTFCLALSLCSICLSPGNLNARTLRMQSYAVSDPRMGGIPAFRVLAPAGWKLTGGLTWNVNLANLVTADAAVSAPDDSAGFYVHPSPMFISGQIQYQWPQGQSYLGMIVMPMPNDPVSFLQQLVLPQQRPGAGNLRLVKHQDLPDWASGIAAVNTQPGGMTQGYGTCARFAYTENGIAWEEDFYCVVLVTRSNISPQNLIWLAERNLSVRARKGNLDAMQPLANAFVNSFRVEHNWYGRFVKVQQQWIAVQQQGIANAGALSRIISQCNDHFDRTMTQAWRARQQAEDRAGREFSEYIRGSEHYSDPVNGTRVELPGGYDHAWTNALGDYVLSNDAGFNPNMHSGNDWTAIEPVR